MATYITEEEIETLIEIENYLGAAEMWRLLFTVAYIFAYLAKNTNAYIGKLIPILEVYYEF